MGNHWGSGRAKEPAGGCVMAVRVLAASAVIAASLFAVGFPGTPPLNTAPQRRSGPDMSACLGWPVLS
ncbi:hypothetical protein AHiyo4_06230 [Arthrobacter sp. Hiyo4]|nr:hypothetical protein AHiyo4_06230 [Arthrobacter sp. Hiyo4]